jgi:hypothetical protein
VGYGRRSIRPSRAPTPAELATLGVARVSYGSLLHRDAMQHVASFLASLAADPVTGQG